MEPCPIPYLNKSKLITLFGKENERKTKPSKLIRELRLIHYLCGRQVPPASIGNAVLQLPRYAFPISHFQCYLGKINPHYYYMALTGVIVGLSIDPSFVTPTTTKQKEEESTDFTSIYPRISRFPRLLNHIPVCQNLGIGIVHSVDIRKHVVTILTPLSTEDMQKVNTLILSTQAIPQSFFNNVFLKNNLNV